jgi:VWFA-related protein
MIIKRCISLLTGVIFLACGSIPLAFSQDKKKAETKDDDVIKITSELVQIDVIVTDKNNKPVTGLKVEDFELFDNDKPQRISFFSYEESKLRRFDEVVGADQPRTLPRLMTTGELKRVVAFIVDNLHMNFSNLYHTRRMLRDFIDHKMEPGDLVLILPTAGGSGMYQQFTADQRLLRNAVSHLRQPFVLDSENPSRRGTSTDQAVLSVLPALAEGRAGVPQAAGQGGTMGSGNYVPELEATDVRATISAINSTIKAMAGFPGRKIAVFLSEGLRSFNTNTESDITDATYRAARANVVFYSINPGGLQTVNFASSDGAFVAPKEVDMSLESPTGFVERSPIAQGTDNTLGVKRADYYESQEVLHRLANETGGKFYKNNNDIAAGLNSLLEENSGYYLLGFQPDADRWDGKYHKVKVVVRDRPELKVSTRKGYLARVEKPQPSNKKMNAQTVELVEAISSPLVRRDIDIQLTPFYRDDTKRDPVFTTLLHIDASRLTFKESGGMMKGKLQMTGLLMSADGKPADNFSHTAELNFTPQDYELVRRDGLLSTRAIILKPGAYQLRVLVREPESGMIGTASSFVDVPNIKADRLATSSIFTDLQIMQQDKAGDAVGSASSLSQRRFKRGSQFAYVMIVYNAKAEGGKTQLELSSRVLRNGQVVFQSPAKPADVLEGSNPPGRIITGAILQIDQLPPDDYMLEVVIIDKLRKKEVGVARQEIDFRIE